VSPAPSPTPQDGEALPPAPTNAQQQQSEQPKPEAGQDLQEQEPTSADPEAVTNDTEDGDENVEAEADKRANELNTFLRRLSNFSTRWLDDFNVWYRTDPNLSFEGKRALLIHLSSVGDSFLSLAEKIEGVNGFADS
jgi:hypothetical protein